MSVTRTLLSDDGEWRIYEVRDDSGAVIGRDREPAPGSTAANEATIIGQVDQAVAGLRNYVGLASPTAAQTTAAVKLLCRVALGLIRLQLRRIDGTD